MLKKQTLLGAYQQQIKKALTKAQQKLARRQEKLALG